MQIPHLCAMEALRLQRIVLAVGLLIMGIKLCAWLITGSVAVLSDALESLVNISAGTFSLYALWLSTRPHDTDHPYGHGKIQFISAGVEGSMILIAAVAIFWKSIDTLVDPEPVEQIPVGIVLTFLAGVLHWVMGSFMIKKGRNSRSLALEAGGKHLRSDAVTSLALILGLLAMQIFPYHWIDPVISMAFGVYVAWNGITVIRASLAGIMDEADPDVLESVVQAMRLHRNDQIIDIHNLRVIRYGSDIHIDAHVTIPWYLNVREGHEILETLSDALKNAFDSRVEVFLHADPCLPASCRICSMIDCPKRAQPFHEKLDWSLNLLQDNKRHK